MHKRITKLISAFTAIILFGFTLQAVAGGPDVAPAPPQTGTPFIKNQISVGIYDDSFLNWDLPTPPSPIFWDASHKAQSGVQIMYQRNFFHTKKWFSINWGASISRWATPHDHVFAFSLLVSFKLWLLRIHHTIFPYIYYSVAAPTILTNRHFAGSNFGANFVFQDMLGVGVQIGARRAFDIALLMVHYSNGDLISPNSGIKVPVELSISYLFP